MAQKGSAAKRIAKVKRACTAIDKHINELAEQMSQGKSEQLVRYLEVCGRFHQYSFRNIMLAFSQRDNITRLAGLRQWNKLGRHVKSGEKSLIILAPMTFQKKAGNEDLEDSSITLFRPVYVFDVSHTEGDELPSLPNSTGDVTTILPALEKAVREANITLEYKQRDLRRADGSSFGGRIVVSTDLEAPETFRTLVHEYAHEKLHWDGPKDEMTIRETEADATAFAVCRHFGVTCDSSDYLLLYDATPKVLLQRLETIRATAAEIIEDILAHLPETDSSLP